MSDPRGKRLQPANFESRKDVSFEVTSYFAMAGYMSSIQTTSSA